MVTIVAGVIILAMVLSLALVLTGNIGKQSGSTNPQDTVREFFLAVSAADGTTLDSIVAPESKNETKIALLNEFFGNKEATIGGVTLKTLKNSGGNATVEVEDFNVITPSGNFKASSKWGNEKAVVTLRQSDGNWLITGVTAPATPLVPAPSQAPTQQ